MEANGSLTTEPDWLSHQMGISRTPGVKAQMRVHRGLERIVALYRALKVNYLVGSQLDAELEEELNLYQGVVAKAAVSSVKASGQELCTLCNKIQEPDEGMHLAFLQSLDEEPAQLHKACPECYARYDQHGRKHGVKLWPAERGKSGHVFACIDGQWQILPPGTKRMDLEEGKRIVEEMSARDLTRVGLPPVIYDDQEEPVLLIAGVMPLVEAGYYYDTQTLLDDVEYVGATKGKNKHVAKEFAPERTLCGKEVVEGCDPEANFCRQCEHSLAKNELPKTRAALANEVKRLRPQLEFENVDLHRLFELADRVQLLEAEEGIKAQLGV